MTPRRKRAAHAVPPPDRERGKKQRRVVLRSEAEILRAAHVSDDLELGPAPPPQLVEMVRRSRSEGVRVVRVYWEGGQVAWMPCPPGVDMPDPAMIIVAYRNSSSNESQRYPEGVLQWLR